MVFIGANTKALAASTQGQELARPCKLLILMPNWSARVRKALSSLGKQPEQEATAPSPIVTVESIERILSDFKVLVEEEPYMEVKSLWMDMIQDSYLELQKQVARIEQLDQQGGKKKKRDEKIAISTMQDIRKALEELEWDVKRGEVIYKDKGSMVTTDETEGWFQTPFRDLLPPAYEMQNAAFYMGPQGNEHENKHAPIPHQEGERTEEKGIELSRKACWLNILGSATAPDQEWSLKDAPSFDPGRERWRQGRSFSESPSAKVSIVAILGPKFWGDDKAIRVLALKSVNVEKYSESRRNLYLRHLQMIQSACTDVNIVNVLAYDTIENEIRLFMEYCSGGTLLAMIRNLGRRLTPHEVIPLARQICDGLRHLHGLDLVHRDLKSENVLIELDGCVKICSLDKAKALLVDIPDHIDGLQSFGSPHWMAPEATGGLFSLRSDVWSLGCLIVELLTNNLPWGDIEPENIRRKLRDMDEGGDIEGPPLPDMNRLGPAGQAALRRIFVHHKNRAGAAGLLEDPWFERGTEEASSPENAPRLIDNVS